MLVFSPMIQGHPNLCTKSILKLIKPTIICKLIRVFMYIPVKNGEYDKEDDDSDGVMIW